MNFRSFFKMFCLVAFVSSSVTFENCASAYSKTEYTFNTNICIEGPFFIESTNNKNYDVYYGEKDSKCNYPTSVSDNDAVHNAVFINCRYNKICAAVIVCKSDSGDCNIAIYPSSSSYVDEIVPYRENYHLVSLYSVIARSPATAYIGNRFYQNGDHLYMKQVSVTIAMNQFPQNSEATIKTLNSCKPDMNVYSSENSKVNQISHKQITDNFTMTIDKPMLFEMVIDDTKGEKQIMINFKDTDSERKPLLIVPPIPGALTIDQLIVLNSITDPLSHYLYAGMCAPYSPVPPNPDIYKGSSDVIKEVFPDCTAATQPDSAFKIYELEKDKEICFNGQFILAYNDEILVTHRSRIDNSQDKTNRYYKNPNIIKDGVAAIKCVKPTGSKCKLQISSLLFNSFDQYYILVNNNFSKEFTLSDEKKDILVGDFNIHPASIKISAKSGNMKYISSRVPTSEYIKELREGNISYLYGKEQIFSFSKLIKADDSSKFTLEITTYPDSSSSTKSVQSIDPDSGDTSFLAPSIVGMIPSTGYAYDWTDIQNEYKEPGSFKESNSATKQGMQKDDKPKDPTSTDSSKQTKIIVGVVVSVVAVIVIAVIVIIVLNKKKKKQDSGSGTEISDKAAENK